jgi:hypothetical protein
MSINEKEENNEDCRSQTRNGFWLGGGEDKDEIFNLNSTNKLEFERKLPKGVPPYQH